MSVIFRKSDGEFHKIKYLQQNDTKYAQYNTRKCLSFEYTTFNCGHCDKNAWNLSRFRYI